MLSPELSMKTGTVDSQPPTVACKNGSSVGTCTRCTHTFFARFAPICMLFRRLVKKFRFRSSGGSLLRVRCWSGWSISLSLSTFLFFFCQSPSLSFIILALIGIIGVVSCVILCEDESELVEVRKFLGAPIGAKIWLG